MSSFRKIAADAIRAALPKKWVFIDDERSLNVLSKPTLVMSQRDLEPSPIAPLSYLSITLALIVLSEHTDPVKAEDALDDLLVEVLNIVQSFGNLTWSKATKIVHQERHMGYEITTQATIQLEH